MTTHPNPPPDAPASVTPSLHQTHPLEKWLQKDWVRFLVRHLAAERPGRAEPHLLRALRSYANPDATRSDRLLYAPIHFAIDRLRGEVSRETLRAKLAGHPPTLRGIIATARSVAHFGLTTPQRWLHPLFIVWNFTHRCNLRCRHCYQSSTANMAENELTLDEKLRLVDEFARHYLAMIAFAGGEPTLSDDLIPVIARCREHGIHTSLATHGGTLTGELCRRLADVGLNYVEVSLDSVDPERHDRFRGVPGSWKRSVQGLRNVIATKGLRAGVAMCVTRENLHEVEDMIRFAIDLGASCFAHFNFIPVGRGAEQAHLDLSPEQREGLLHLLYRHMNERKIGIISTAPQFGRICLTQPDVDGLVSCSHAGNAAGAKARVVAKYLGGCGAGRTYLCLQPNGDLTPCVYMPDRTMGNLRERSLTDIFQNSPWWDLFCDRDERQGYCGECEYRLYCGGCRARADAYFNRLDHADPGCPRNEEHWRRLCSHGQDAAQGNGQRHDLTGSPRPCSIDAPRH